jgi:hypothetical protein
MDGRTVGADSIHASEPAPQLLSFDDALQLLSADRPVSARDVSARALARPVWVAEWHMPGCMSELHGYCTTKRDAITECLAMAEGSEGPPRGMRADLQRYGQSSRTAPDAYARGAISAVSRCTLSDLL